MNIMRNRSRFSYHRQGTMSYTVTHRETGAALGELWRTRYGWMIRSATRKREVYGVSRETAAALLLSYYELSVGADGALAARAGTSIAEVEEDFGQIPVSGDLFGKLGRDARGQLWERIAQAEPTSPRIKALAHRIAVEAKLRRPMTHGGPGLPVINYRAAAFGLMNSGASGVIRAGVRVK